MRKRLTLPLLACAFAALCPAGRAAAEEMADDRYYVVKTRLAITISGEEIKNARIVIKNGKIEAVGENVDFPSDSRIIDAGELVVMPGMIDPYTSIGLEMAPRNGNQSNRKVADDFYPPEDDTYQKLLEAGFTTLALHAPGGGLTGQADVISTHEPKEKTGLKTQGLVRITMTRPATEKKMLAETLKAAKEQIEKEEKAATQPTTKPAAPPVTSQPTTSPTTQPTTQPATRPATQPAQPAGRPELSAAVALLKKEDGWLAHIELSRASDLMHLEQVIDDYNFARAFVFRGFAVGDVRYVLENPMLGRDAIVAFPPMLFNLPMTVTPYNPPREFSARGCDVVLFPASDTVLEHERMRERLALLVRAGLSREVALKAVTLNAARFLDMDDELGSIEKERRADLIFLDGDPLDPQARVQRVMVNGRMVFDRAKEKKKERR